MRACVCECVVCARARVCEFVCVCVCMLCARAWFFCSEEALYGNLIIKKGFLPREDVIDV